MSQGLNVPEGEQFEHPVEVKLTDRELLALGEETATIDADRRELENAHAHVKTKYKEEMAAIDARSAEVVQRLRTKKETRIMPCINDFDFDSGICTIRRADTLDPVKTRRMEAEEYRRALPFPKPKAIEDKKAAG
jgi:hypothetical protein